MIGNDETQREINKLGEIRRLSKAKIKDYQEKLGKVRKIRKNQEKLGKIRKNQEKIPKN